MQGPTMVPIREFARIRGTLFWEKYGSYYFVRVLYISASPDSESPIQAAVSPNFQPSVRNPKILAPFDRTKPLKGTLPEILEYP